MADAPENMDDVVADLERGLGDLDKHRETYELRERYDEGKVDELIAHPALKALLAKYSERFRLNYAAVPVDARVDRLDLHALRTGDQTADDRLQADLWDANELDDDADDYHRKACALGDYYVVLWPYPAGDEREGQVEVIPKHPTTTRILYSRENSRQVDFAVTRWQAGKDRWRVNLYYDDSVHEFVAERSDGTKAEAYKYVETDEGEPSIETHDYGFNVFHFRPDRKPYGRPVNERAYGPQDGITKTVANMMASQDYAGFPQRYALVDPNAEVDDDMDGDFGEGDTLEAIDSTTDKTKAAGESKLKSEPGSAWILRGMKGAGQFEAADPDAFLKPLDKFIRAIATLTKTPLRLFDSEGAGSAGDSGEARRRDDAPLTKHAAKLQGTFGQTWTSIADWCLSYWGLSTDKLEPEAVWAPAEVATDKEGMELVGTKILNGVPPREALLQAGYTPDQVDEWLPDGDVYALTPALISSLATSLQALGQAKTLGSVSDTQIASVFARYVGERGAGSEPQPPTPAPAPAPAPAPQG